MKLDEPRIASQDANVIAPLLQDWYKRHLNLGSQGSRFDPKSEATVATSGWNRIHSDSGAGERETVEDDTSESPTPSPKPGPAPETIDDKALRIDATRIPFGSVSRADGLRQGQIPDDEPMLAGRPEALSPQSVAEVGVKSKEFVTAIPRFASHQVGTVEQASQFDTSVNITNLLNAPYAGPTLVSSVPIGDRLESSRRVSVPIDTSSRSDDPTIPITEQSEPSAFIAVSRRPMNDLSRLDTTPSALSPAETAVVAGGLSRDASSSVAESSTQDLEQSIERLLSVLDQVLRGERASLTTGRRRYPLN